jgi:hypothetical protein
VALTRDDDGAGGRGRGVGDRGVAADRGSSDGVTDCGGEASPTAPAGSGAPGAGATVAPDGLAGSSAAGS